MEQYDLIILGHGSAAFAAAIKANDLKIKTAMVGDNATPGTVMGGTCVNVGCVPSKRLITVGNLFYAAQNNSFEGLKYGKGKLAFRKVIEQKDEEIVEKLRKEKYEDVLKNLEHVAYIKAMGKFISKSEIEAGGRVLQGRKFIVASGARANIISVPGLDKVDYLTNEEALNLKELPSSLAIIGGRALGLEFAQMYAHFGTKVTVLQRSGRILPEEEPEISESLKKYMEDEWMKIITGMKINNIEKRGKNKVLNVTAEGHTFDVECEQLLFAAGRKPNTDGMALETAGVKTDERGFILVNNEMQTSADNIWAAGDVTGEPMLEPLAAKEGAIAVENAFTESKKKINLDEVPHAIFTYPEVASVGLLDAKAVEQGINCTCNTLPLSLVPKARIIGDTRGLVKLVVHNTTGKILGVHMLAPHAADMIHEGVLAVKFGLTIDDIIDTVHVFPTLSEAMKIAAQSFKRDVTKMSCCIE